MFAVCSLVFSAVPPPTLPPRRSCRLRPHPLLCPTTSRGSCFVLPESWWRIWSLPPAVRHHTTRPTRLCPPRPRRCSTGTCGGCGPGTPRWPRGSPRSRASSPVCAAQPWTRGFGAMELLSQRPCRDLPFPGTGDCGQLQISPKPPNKDELQPPKPWHCMWHGRTFSAPKWPGSRRVVRFISPRNVKKCKENDFCAKHQVKSWFLECPGTRGGLAPSGVRV